MRALAVQPNTLDERYLGGLITRDQPTADGTFRKGHRISSTDLSALQTATQPIHLVMLDANDMPEAEAVPQIAATIRGGHTQQSEIRQGRINILSSQRGLLAVDRSALNALNAHPAIGVFTTIDGLAVDANQVVAGVKIGPVAIPVAELELALSKLSSPIIDVRPFLPLKVVCLVSEALDGRVRDRFELSLHAKIAWYGGTLAGIDWLADERGAISEGLSHRIGDVDLILTAGSHMMDPLDATMAAVEHAGGEIERCGAPAHPGSMVWLAYIGATPVLGLAGCSMFSRSTVADLLLPRLFAGQRVTAADIGGLGYGGLLDRDMDWRFPPYGRDS